MSSFKVDVLGAKGRVGSIICEAAETADDLELAAGLDSGDDLNKLVTAGAQTIVDFTQPDSVMGNLKFCIKNGIDAVVGITGFTKECLDQVQRWLDDADGDASILIAPNLAISVVLTMKMAELAAPYFDSVGVIEMHYPLKKDAPSGTAIHTVEAIARARKEAGMGEQSSAIEQTPDGARGAEVEGISVHAVHMTGSVAHKTITFGAEEQSLTIKQDFYSRTNLVSSALLGVCKIEDFPGLTVGLEPFLGLQWPGVS